MNTSPTSLLPVEQTERIYSLDILRGVVSLGILLMIVGFGLAEGDPSVAVDRRAESILFTTTTIFFQGF